MSWPFLSQKTGLFITNFKQFGSIFAGMGPKMCLEFWKSRILELLISIVWSMDKWILAKILSKFASDPGIIFKCGKTSNETIFITFSWFQNRVFIFRLFVKNPSISSGLTKILVKILDDQRGGDGGGGGGSTFERRFKHIKKLTFFVFDPWTSGYWPKFYQNLHPTPESYLNVGKRQMKPFS